jgi:transposase InsO family protein
VAAGARQSAACEELGIDERTVQRWRGQPEDGRAGPKTTPPNALTTQQRRRVLDVLTSERFRDQSPRQIVPQLADEGLYVASESTMYRLLRSEELLAHRGRSRPSTHHRPPELVASAVNTVWSWDITYLQAPVRGSFFYLYLVEDLYSRSIVGWEVHAEESAEAASKLIERTCRDLNVDAKGLHLHSDNGAPMKGATMLATLQRLGVVASFSRPRVSDDNPYSEALFRTLKYRPGFPNRPFRDIEEAREWVSGFVRWYNTQHLHSALNFVTPDDRYHGRDKAILAERHRLYQRTRKQQPHRWSGETRNWSPAPTPVLNPHRVLPQAAA